MLHISKETYKLIVDVLRLMPLASLKITLVTQLRSKFSLHFCPFLTPVAKILENFDENLICQTHLLLQSQSLTECIPAVNLQYQNNHLLAGTNSVAMGGLS